MVAKTKKGLIGMSEQLSIRVSGIKYDKPVGKHLELAAGGGIAGTRLLKPRAGGGRVINEAFAIAGEAFAYRMKADARTMFFTGTFKNDFTTNDNYIGVPRAALNEARNLFDASDWHTVIGVTKDYLAFRPGPGLLPIDIDVKRSDEVAALWPDEPFRLETIDEVVAAVLEMLPEARGCPMLVVASSSSMIVDVDNKALRKGPGGWRVIIPIDDATRIPEVLETIHVRCWTREQFRFAFIGKGANFYPRSLADQALGKPTQPDYVMADLGAGLAKAADAAKVFNEDGAWLKAHTVTLSDEERMLADSNIAAARAVLAPKATVVRSRAITTHVGKLMKKGVPKAAAVRAAAKRFEAGKLAGSDVIGLDDGCEIQASVLLTADGEKYDGRLCLDPVEPDYDGGRAVGKIFWNEGQRPGVHSYAHGSKFWKVQHDAETAAAAIDAAGNDVDAIVLIFARADVDDVHRDQLEDRAAKLLHLGSRRISLRDSVAQQRQRIAAAAAQNFEEDDTMSARKGPLPLTVALPRHTFPYTEPTQNGIRVLDHVDNIEHMLKAYAIGYRYNVILKDIDWRHPGIHQGGDNAETVLYSQMLSLCALNKVPTDNLSGHMTALADLHEYNPVVEHLSTLGWDGRPRFDALADAMQASDAVIARIVLRLFLIQACAAADNAAWARKLHPEYRAHFEGTLVLVGEQGIGKTKGLRKLLLQALRRYFKEGLTLDVKNKDSITAAVSCWIAELGELEGTFRKVDIAELKAFVSKDTDEIRAPYARKRSLFARRAAFTGTVNDPSFLADETGNRRFWPLTVGRLDVDWSDDDLKQLWAEAWSRYASGEQWWPSPDEDVLLAENAERYRYQSGLEEAIEKHFQWGRRPDWKVQRLTATLVYGLVKYNDGVGALTPSAKKTIGATLSRLWRKSGKVGVQNGVLVVTNQAGETVRVNADNGRNRGWLLPPKQTTQQVKSGFSVVDGDKADGAMKAAFPGVDDDDHDHDGNADAEA